MGGFSLKHQKNDHLRSFFCVTLAVPTGDEPAERK